jgi:hypothetical protein
MTYRELKGNVVHLKIEDAKEQPFNGFIVFACDDDGHLRHVEIHSAKAGSTLHGLLGTLETTINHALQDHVTFDALLADLEGQVYSPKGPTNDPDIPEVTSLADYLARKMRQAGFVEPQLDLQPEPQP